MIDFKQDILDVFDSAQKGVHSSAQLTQSLKKLYESMDFEEFFASFLQMTKFALVEYQRFTAAERVIDLVVKFGVVLSESHNENSNKENHGSDLPEEDMHPFLLRYFEFLLKHHNAHSKGVRFRCCQLVAKLLSGLGDNAQIDEDLFQGIYEGMLTRTRDLLPTVRVQAILALARLQVAGDPTCKVGEAYRFLMTFDPSAEVRRAALSVIQVSPLSLKAILDRTRDVRDSVQKQAYEVLAEKVHIKALTIAQRIQLMSDGLKSRSVSVRKTCSTKLLQAWIRMCDGKVIQLLYALDTESCVRTAETVLQAYFSNTPKDQLLATLDILDERHLVPASELTAEVVVYWRCLNEYIKSLGAEYEELQDTICPTPLNFCSYFKELQRSMEEESDLNMQLTNEFILEQLLGLAKHLDVADESGRRGLVQLVLDTLQRDRVSATLVSPLLTLYSSLVSDPVRRINALVEVISEIQMPIMSSQPMQVNDDALRQRNVQIAQIRVQLNELREELRNCVELQEFERAAEIKHSISQLEKSKNDLSSIEEEEDTGEVQTQKNDPQTLVKCLTIAAEMLTRMNYLRSIPAALYSLLENQVLPGVQNMDPAVRNVAFKTLGLICIFDKDLSSRHLLLFLQAASIDVSVVKMSALRAIINILLIFGLQSLGVNSTTSASVSENAREETLSISDTASIISDADHNESRKQAEEPAISDQVQSALSFLIGLLESESGDVLTLVGEGLSKLLMAGRITSWRLFSRLFLLWFNPVTESGNRIHHCLGTFFPIYAFRSRANQAVVEEAFLPILTTMLDAPASSPLSQADVKTAADVLVQLTNVKHLVPAAFAELGDEYCHDSIALKVCNAILKDPRSFNVKTLCFILSCLELCKTNTPALQNLQVMCSDILKVVKDKQCVRLLDKFYKQVRDHLKAAGESVLGTPAAHQRSLSGTHAGRELNDSNIPDSSVLYQTRVNCSTLGGKMALHSLNESTMDPPPPPTTAGDPSSKTKSVACSAKIPRKSVTFQPAPSDDDVFASPSPLRPKSRRKKKETVADPEQQVPVQRATRSQTKKGTDRRAPLNDIRNETT